MEDNETEPAPEQEGNPPEQQEEGKSVPIADFESEKALRQQAQDDLRLFRESFAANTAQQRQETQTAKSSVPELDDTDVLTVGDYKKSAREIASSFGGRLSELEMSIKHDDYNDVVTNFLPDVLKENPALRNTLQNTQDHALAYYLGKSSDRYRKEAAKNKMSSDAKRIVENSEASGSLSSIGGTSSASPGSRYLHMSDEDFIKESNKHLP
jgi:hypothetical protein